MNDGPVSISRAADRTAQLWRNGAGTTSEIFVSPPGERAPFDWRLSVATVDRDVEFSRFAGVDRSLMALSEPGLDLLDNGAPVHLNDGDTYSFPGENVMSSVNVTRPTLDLNLMTRRGRFHGVLESHSMRDGSLVTVAGGEITIVMVTRGRLRQDSNELDVLDAIRLDPCSDTTRSLTFTGDGRVVVARIRASTRP